MSKYIFRLKFADEPIEDVPDLSFENDIPKGDIGQTVDMGDLGSVDSGSSREPDSTVPPQPVEPEKTPEEILDDEAREVVISLVKKYKANGITDIQSIRDNLYDEGWTEERLWDLFDKTDDQFDDVAESFKNASISDRRKKRLSAIK